jgi:hypothetical protein
MPFREESEVFMSESGSEKVLFRKPESGGRSVSGFEKGTNR